MTKKIIKKKYVPEFNVIPKSEKNKKINDPLLEVSEVLWGNTLLQVRHYAKPTNLSIGEDKHCDFFLSLDSFNGKPFNIIEVDKLGAYQINFNKEMEGYLFLNGEAISFFDLRNHQNILRHENKYCFKIKPGIAVNFQFGAMQYYIHFVSKEAIKHEPLHRRFEYTINSIMILLVLAYAVFGLYLKSLPAPEVADILDTNKIRNDGITVFLPKEKPPELIVKIRIGKAPATLGEMGKKGKEKSVLDKTKGGLSKRIKDQQEAVGSGLLMASGGMPKFDLEFGGSLEENIGELTGYSGEDIRGKNGLGTKGSGLAAGGDSLGLGDGLGIKNKRGYRYGVDGGGKIKKKSKIIDVIPRNPSVTGGLDKSIIERLITKRRSQIRYCYQKELNTNPDLYGKISIRFMISASGIVRQSKVYISTMKNQNVEQCVARTLKRIIFPKPKGGGVVQVTYPFLFKSSD